MKSLKFLLTAILFIAFNAVQAQATTSNTQITTQQTPLPDWGVAGYDNATYYYIPATETYYDIRNQKYVYMQKGKWIRSNEMPSAYTNYDLYNGYKVVITDTKEPFANHPSLKAKYPISYKGEVQPNIRPRE